MLQRESMKALSVFSNAINYRPMYLIKIRDLRRLSIEINRKNSVNFSNLKSPPDSTCGVPLFGSTL